LCAACVFTERSGTEGNVEKQIFSTFGTEGMSG
jgi:hypothetical protein